jgi:hypothetical protein
MSDERTLDREEQQILRAALRSSVKVIEDPRIAEARRIAIDDAVKVVKECEKRWNKMKLASLKNGEDPETTMRMRHIEAAAMEIASRLEALKEAK